MAVIGRFPKQAETVWKRYNIVTTYYWNKWNSVGTTYYYWNKYNVDSTYSYTWDSEGNFRWGCPISNNLGGYFGTSIRWNQKTGTFDLIGNTTTCWDNYDSGSQQEYVQALNSYGYVGNSFSDNKKISHVRNAEWVWGAGGSASGQIQTTIVTGGISKGSSLGQISSSTRNTYPDNAMLGDYWYEYVNSDISYSKGTTSYGQVSSTNRSAYPDNSYSGSYWYVYSRSTQSCGSYIGEVSSDNETAYPANGAQSGYWYIKVQQ